MHSRNSDELGVNLQTGRLKLDQTENNVVTISLRRYSQSR